MNAGPDKQANLRRAEELVAQAAGHGNRLVVLPELFNLYGDLARVAAEAETIDGPTCTAMRRWAQNHRVNLIGSYACRLNDAAKPVNLAVAIDPAGAIVAQYAKVHLFDIDLPGKVTSRESDHLSAGVETALTPVAWAKAGLAICYDLRFPELFRRYAAAKAELLVVPSAFTRTTGLDHWELLVRTRAIENQAFVIAANQVGSHQPTGASYGHSLIVDPWGQILAAADGEHEAVISAALQRRRLDDVRARLPALSHIRLTSC
jgi:deaminated glutathione amidase